MTKKLETKLEIKSWDEQPYREFPDGSKFTRAEVVLAGDDTGLESGHFDALMYYRPDGTSAYVALLELNGTIGDREGTVVLRGEGTYDGKAAKSKSTVAHATGDLDGIKLTVESVSTHDDYPFMPLTLKYE